MASEQLTNRLRAFRDERILWVRQEEVGVRLKSPHLVVLHLMPTAALRGAAQFDLATLRAIPADEYLRPMTVHSGWSEQVNFDGLRVVELLGATQSSYVQIFRNGVIEAVDTLIVDSDAGCALYSGYEVGVREGAIRYLQCLKHLGITGECAIGLTLVEMKGFSLQHGLSFRRHRPAIDRALLKIPEETIELGADEKTVTAALRRIFDLVWNCAGVGKSPNFTENGEFKPVG